MESPVIDVRPGSAMSDNLQGACDGTAVLTRELHVRVINVSASGCLVESHQRLDVGVVATLRVALGGKEYTDDVQILRCQAIRGRVGPSPGCAVSLDDAATSPVDSPCRHAACGEAGRSIEYNPCDVSTVEDCRGVGTAGATCISRAVQLERTIPRRRFPHLGIPKRPWPFNFTPRGHVRTGK